MQTFIHLRDNLTDIGVELPSYKVHFDDFDYFREEIFDFVSGKHMSVEF